MTRQASKKQKTNLPSSQSHKGIPNSGVVQKNVTRFSSSQPKTYTFKAQETNGKSINLFFKKPI